eukprot:gene18532-5086_t
MAEADVPEPIDVEYCGEWPGSKFNYEESSIGHFHGIYCENGPCPDRCKESRPAEEAGDGGDDEAGEAEGGGGKKSKRGGKATRASKAAQKVVAKPTGVVISITQRNKRKFVTNVTGLGSYGINLKKAAKAFAGRFACGAAVNGDDEIGITGDHTNEIADVIIDKFPEVLAADITFKKK